MLRRIGEPPTLANLTMRAPRIQPDTDILLMAESVQLMSNATDAQVIDFLKLSGVSEAQVALLNDYISEQH